MFGYISVDRPELKIKEFETFRAYYCGLCHALGEYSAQAKLLLNYDCTFLYLLMEGLREKKPVYYNSRCALHPLQVRQVTEHSGADFAAAVNVMLGVQSLRDHAADDRSLSARAAAAVLTRDYEKAKSKYPETAQLIEARLLEQQRTEQKKEADIDLAADPFARLLAGIFEQASSEGNARQMRALGYNLGRWIYLIDACDDYQKDAKKNRYNPFLQKFGANAEEEVRKSAEFHLNASAAKACMAYDLLEIKKHAAILDNIVYSGLYRKTDSVLNRGKDSDGSVQRTGR